MPAFVVADDGRAPGFVMGDPVLDPVAQSARDRIGHGDEGVDGGALVPAAALLQDLRQVPVVERGPGLQSAFQHAVDQALVEIQPPGVGRAAGFAEDARPGDRKTVGIRAQAARDVQVFGPAVVMVAGDRAAGAVADAARRRGETVPDRFDPAVRLRRPFDLVGGCRAAPQETGVEIRAPRRRVCWMEKAGWWNHGLVDIVIGKLSSFTAKKSVQRTPVPAQRVRPPCASRSRRWQARRAASR
jgi:hypothetical protein